MPKHCEVILYQEDGWNASRILTVIESKQSIKNYAFILHDKDVDNSGKSKPSHYHVYLNFGTNNVQFQHIAQWFGIKENLVSKIKANKYATIKYFIHKDYPDKFQYDVSNVYASFDIEKFLNENERNESLNNLLQRCANGEITPFNYEKYIDVSTYAKFQSQFERAWSYREQRILNDSKGHRDCNIIWLCGDSAVGKTTLCSLFAEKKGLSLYRTATGKDPFSHYAGQPAILLDDLRPNSPFSFDELLRITDPYNACPVQSRYRNKVLKCSFIFITTILTPMEFVKHSFFNKNEDTTQLMRRISELWLVERTQIQIRKFDIEQGTFLLGEIVPNPVPMYLRTLKSDTKALDSGKIFTDLQSEFERDASKEIGKED